MRAMKDSGVDWIGCIPEEWETGRISQLYTERKEKVSDRDYEPLSVTMKGILPQLATAAKTDAHDDRKLVKKGDFAINSRSDRRGSCGISGYDGSVSLINTILKPHNNMNAGYYNWLFHSSMFSDEFYKWGHGIVDDLWTTGWQDMKKIAIPLPPINEQERISSFLDQKCEYVDSVISKTSKTLEEYRILRQAVITQAVTRGVRGKRSMKDSNVDWLGKCPVDWDIHRIANLYEERSENGEADLPILQVSINTGISDHEIADKDLDRVFVRSEDRTKYKRVYPGDLAYNMMRAWQGAFGAVRVDGMISPAYVVAKPKDSVQIDSRYMEALLRTPEAIEEMHRYSRGIADFRLRLYWPEFKNIRVCFPSYEEQVEIADYIDENTSAIDRLIQKKEQYLVELETMKKSLIYEYVTGKKEV